MKKYYLIVVLGLGLISCEDKTSKTDDEAVVIVDETQNKTQEVDQSNWADQIIEFNNEVIDYLNESSKHVEYTVRFSDGLNKMVTDKTNYHATNNIMAFIGRSLDMDKVVENAPSDISESLKNNLKDIDVTYQSLKKINDNIDKYRRSEDYKDDDWKKGGEYLVQLNEGIDDYYKYKDLIAEELAVLADKAEEKSLEGHPLKDPILAAKKDLNLLDDLQRLILEDTLDRTSLDLAYAKLEKSSKLHREEFNSILEEYQKKESYDDFHEDIDIYLGTIRKVLRYERALNENDFNTTLVYYKTIITRYNSFVN